MSKRNYPLAKVYALLEPGPVVLVTTAHKGRSNVMAMSWLMPIEFEPPQLACILSGRNRSFEMLRASRECVVNIPTADLAEQVVACGNSHGDRSDKFAQFGLTPRPAALVAAPLIEECYANLECRIADSRLVNRYNLFILEVVKAWIDPAVKEPKTLHHRGRGVFAVDGEVIRLRSRMK